MELSLKQRSQLFGYLKSAKANKRPRKVARTRKAA